MAAAVSPPSQPPRTLIIACGALAREVTGLIAAHGWSHMSLTCLPADLHNRPARIPALLRARLDAARGKYDRTVVMYGDCGTGGALDRVVDEYGAERMPGDHCYATYAGEDDFAQLAEAEPGTFYLTDYLVRQFDTIVWKGLGLDRHPQLRDTYFGNYTTLMYLAQTEDEALEAAARKAKAGT